MTRLHLGLTDHERRERDQRRRTRNSIIGAVICVLVIGWLTCPN